MHGHIRPTLPDELRSRSYRPYVHILTGVQGVSLSHGDATSGHTLFVLMVILQHDLNITVVRTSACVRLRPVPSSGMCTFLASGSASGKNGLGTLLINDESVGSSISKPTTSSIPSSPSWASTSASTKASHVSDYQAPFCLRPANSQKVVVNLDDDQDLDGECGWTGGDVAPRAVGNAVSPPLQQSASGTIPGFVQTTSRWYPKRVRAVFSSLRSLSVSIATSSRKDCAVIFAREHDAAVTAPPCGSGR